MAKIIKHKVFMSRFNRTRTINVSLPSNYDESGRRFPVIYVLDGESALEKSAEKTEWSFCYDTTVDRMIAAQEFSGAIIVAVESANEYNDLFSEYSYPRDNEYSFTTDGWFGWGDIFGNWMAYELKPYVDAHFRTFPGRDFTAVAGSSLSGTYAVWLGLKYPQIYSKVAAFSPGVSFSDGKDMLSYVPQFAILHKPEYLLRMYLQVGTAENVPGGATSDEKYVQDVTGFFSDYLCGIGFTSGDDAVLNIVENGSHTTECWQKYVREAICWLF